MLVYSGSALRDLSSRQTQNVAKDMEIGQPSNLYVCPGGTELRKYHRAFAKPRDGLTKEGTLIYFASKRDCEGLRAQAEMLPKHACVQDRALRS